MRNLLLVTLASALAGWARAEEPTAIPLYGKNLPAGVTVQHRIEKGRYRVRWTMAGTLRGDLPPAKKEFVPPKQALACEAPEAGTQDKPRVESSLLVTAKVAVKGARVEVALEHRKYRPPGREALEGAAGERLSDLADRIVAGCFPEDRAGAVQGVLRSQVRGGQSAFVRQVLEGLVLAYEGEVDAAKKHPRAAWTYLARLLRVPDKGEAPELYERCRAAVCGWRVEGVFDPELAEAPWRFATSVPARGEIGRAVLVGRAGSEGGGDWWRVEMGDPEDPIAALEGGTDVWWMRVAEVGGGLKGCYLRVFSASKEPKAYKLQVTHRKGDASQWIEVHPRPPAEKKLPY